MKLLQTNTNLIIKNSYLGRVLTAIGLFILSAIIYFTAQVGIVHDQDGQPTPSLLVALMLLPLLLVGVFLLFSAKSRVVVLRKSGSSTLSIKKLIGGASSSESFNTDEIVSVRLSVTYSSSTNSAPLRRSQLMLDLGDGSIIELTDGSQASGFSISGLNLSGVIKAPLKNEADIVANYLGVPLHVDDLNPIEIVKSIAGLANNQSIGRTNTNIKNPVTPIGLRGSQGQNSAEVDRVQPVYDHPVQAEVIDQRPEEATQKPPVAPTS